MRAIQKKLVFLFLTLAAVFVFSASIYADTYKLNVHVTSDARKYDDRTMYVGDKMNLKVYNGDELLDPEDVAFSSNRTYIATVNKNGVIRAKESGRVKIRVKYKGHKKAAFVYINVYDDWDGDSGYSLRRNRSDRSYKSDRSCRSERYGSWKTVCVSSGYLALRYEPCYASYNEIGRLYSGDSVEITGSKVTGYDGRKYVWVYSPRLHNSGYVNAAYLY